MVQKGSLIGLWASTIIILLLSGLQGFTGNWIVIFILWAGGPTLGAALTRILATMPNYHILAGFIIGIISILALIFAFFSRTHILVRVFAVIGFITVTLAVWGGFLYVTSEFQDRLSLGQMADAFVGVFAAYFLLFVFLYRTSGFSFGKIKTD
jgi:hypothetical protein